MRRHKLYNFFSIIPITFERKIVSITRRQKSNRSINEDWKYLNNSLQKLQNSYLIQPSNAFIFLGTSIPHLIVLLHITMPIRRRIMKRRIMRRIINRTNRRRILTNNTNIFSSLVTLPLQIANDPFTNQLFNGVPFYW